MRSRGQEGRVVSFLHTTGIAHFSLVLSCSSLFLVILPGLGFFRSTLQYYVDNQFWLWTYLQNWLYIIKPTGETHILHHLWSLAVEEQFYILWPIAIILSESPNTCLLLL
ncbi:MAG: hypothetical protein WDO71_03785 [Bacteroidota bacterium]